MVQTLIYRGGGDNGFGVYAHIIGTEYTYEVTQYDAANIAYNNTFSQAGEGFVFRSDDDDNTGGYGSLYYSSGSGVTLLATDDNSNAISIPTAFSVFAGESIFVGTNIGVTNNGIPTVLMTTNGGAAPSVLLPDPIEFYTHAGGYLWAVSAGDLYRIDENRNPTLVYDRNDDNELDIDYMFEFNGALYLRGDVSLDNDFYRVDPDTGVLTELNIGENGGGDSIYFWYGGVGDSQFYFWLDDGSGNGTELFVSDGTSGGTALVEDIKPGSSSSYVGHRTSPITVGDKLYFIADVGTSDDEELWVSDGTALGTFALSGTGTPVGALGFLSDMSAIPLGDELLFSADGGDGLEVYITDGTQAGTQLLIEINTLPSPYATSTSPTFWIAAGGLVYFSIDYGPNNDSVWVTDGTPAGTRVVSDPHSGNGQREPWLLNIVDLQIDDIPHQIINGTANADQLYGTYLREIFNSGGGNDMLYAGDGAADILNGGDGMDYARYDDANYGDLKVSLTDPSLNTGAAAGDTYTDVEGLILGAGNDIIDGDDGDNYLHGGGGHDTVNGHGGNDILIGGPGADTMSGGADNDTYFVDDAGDTVVEAADNGLDLIKSVVSYTLSANVENSMMLGSSNIFLVGNELDNTLIGNDGNNILNGRAGADRMFGNAGNDTYIVDSTSDVVGEVADNGVDLIKSVVSYTLSANVENGMMLGSDDIFLAGNELDNTLVGNAGNNTLNGRAGDDRMFGGVGNDTYLVDSTSDLIGEASGSGVDLIKSVVSYTLSANVENGILLGSGSIFLAGNELANTLVGNAGKNTLNGRAGDDRMFGGAGDDTYVVDSANDLVGEVAGNGIDTILSVVSRVTDAEVERLTLIGNGNINGVGNGLANVIIGNGGANTILGGAGNDTIKGAGGLDTLTGGLGSDSFVFSSVSESGPGNLQRDRITDFKQTENDRIFLSSIDANTGIGGNQAFVLDNNGSFSVGEIRQTQFGSNLLLEMNTDADAAAEMSILLLNSGLLDAGDFVL